MTARRVAILREWKTDAERRAPLTPDHVAALIADGLRVCVEPSPVRIHSDDAYRAAGAEVTSDIDGCDFFVGIKEVPVERVRAGKPYLFFSHTHKGQPYNRRLLERFLDGRGTLLDYELVTNDEGERLIFFGVQAGQAGMINSLWTLGRRLLAQGLDTPFAALRQARRYDSLDAARAALREVGARIAADGLPEELTPLVVGVTGIGNVSRGAQEMLDLLGGASVEPPELLAGEVPPSGVVKVVFRERHMVRPARGQPYDRAEYRAHPDRYEGIFSSYLPHLDVLVAANYWDERYPRLVTRSALRDLFAHGPARLRVIGDVSCDVEGGIECTLKATLPDDPVYTYDPATGSIADGFDGRGLAVMAVDILPTELPRESSAIFSAALRPFLHDVAAASFDVPFEELTLPGPFRRAVIAHRGELTPPHAWLLNP